jgi:hypothetical protein
MLAMTALAPATARAAQGMCGTAAGFQVDGQFYSSEQYTDWAQGNLGVAVFEDDGTAMITPSLRARDGRWGANGTGFDEAFMGSDNRNNDDIRAQTDPWTWGMGSGPSKLDLTDVYASSAIVQGELWLFLGAGTRASTGGHHLDFEISSAGFARNGDTSGTVVGLGPDAGRTAGVDFLVSVDFADGATVPTVSFRTWQLRPKGHMFVKANLSDGDVFACTNNQTVPAAPWGSVAPNGSESMQVSPLQFVEVGLNLTSLGIDPSTFCSSGSNLMVKTRANGSFTGPLKDFTVQQLHLVPTPVATITGAHQINAGSSTELCGPEGDYDYAWNGPVGALPNQRCITVSDAGTYTLTINDRATGCVSDAAAHDLAVVRAPVVPMPSKLIVNTNEATTSTSGLLEEPAMLAGAGTTNGAVSAGAYLRTPNPVRGSATLEFGIPEAASTRIVVYDVSGRIVAHLVDRTVAAGDHTAPLGIGRQSGMSNGVYFVRMEARGVESGERFQETSKLVVIR